jgi:hypothetical protein
VSFQIGNERFVLKRGRGFISGIKEEGHNLIAANAGHTCNEYLALLVYRVLGVPVPDCALYTCRVQLDGQDFVQHFILTRFIEGRRVTHEEISSIRDRFQEHAGVDVLLSNFDVAGATIDNLLLAANGTLFRIDSGGTAPTVDQRSHLRCAGTLNFGGSGKQRAFAATALDDFDAIVRPGIDALCCEHRLSGL